MSLCDFFKNIPNFWRLLLDHLTRTTNGVHEAELFEAANDEWLEQNECHLLRKTTLAELQRRTRNNHRTTGVINALTEKILTEATLLTFKHVGE